jgi:hypothetical protein
MFLLENLIGVFGSFFVNFLNVSFFLDNFWRKFLRSILFWSPTHLQKIKKKKQYFMLFTTVDISGKVVLRQTAVRLQFALKQPYLP